MQNKEFHIKPLVQFIFPTVMILMLMLLPSKITAQQKLLLGEINVEQILETDNLFRIHSTRYQPDEKALRYLSEMEDSVEIYIFFGSWCRESRKYLPGLLKSLKLANPENADVNYIGVNKEKNFPESFLKLYNIKYIPTVVVYQGSKEIGRIEEKPHNLIELELVEILKKEKEFLKEK